MVNGHDVVIESTRLVTIEQSSIVYPDGRTPLVLRVGTTIALAPELADALVETGAARYVKAEPAVERRRGSR